MSERAKRHHAAVKASSRLAVTEADDPDRPGLTLIEVRKR